MSDADARWHHEQAERAKLKVMDFWQMDEPDDDEGEPGDPEPRPRRQIAQTRYLPDWCCDCKESYDG